MSGNIKSRVDKLEDSLFSSNADEYRKLCFSFNLFSCSDEDLIEAGKSILEERPMDSGTMERLYAPIPVNASQYRIDKAKASHPEAISCGDENFPQKVYENLLDYEKKIMAARASLEGKQ